MIFGLAIACLCTRSKSSVEAGDNLKVNLDDVDVKSSLVVADVDRLNPALVSLSLFNAGHVGVRSLVVFPLSLTEVCPLKISSRSLRPVLSSN